MYSANFKEILRKMIFERTSLIAKEERGMKLLVEEFKWYMSEKELEVNPEKSKVVRFEKRAGIKGKREWKWGESEIKEVNEFIIVT